MTEMDDLYRLRNHAIDMEDLAFADTVQSQISRTLGSIGVDVARGDSDSADETEVRSGLSELSENEINPLEELQAVGSATELTPEMVQRAINFLDPNAANAASDAEIVLGYATFGQSQHPESEEWFNVAERASKIYRHRISRANL